MRARGCCSDALHPACMARDRLLPKTKSHAIGYRLQAEMGSQGNLLGGIIIGGQFSVLTWRSWRTGEVRDWSSGNRRWTNSSSCASNVHRGPIRQSTARCHWSGQSASGVHVLGTPPRVLPYLVDYVPVGTYRLQVIVKLLSINYYVHTL